MTPKFLGNSDNKIYCRNCYKKIQGNGEIFTVVYSSPEEELKQFKNKWRIITLRHIATLLKNIADFFETKEKEMTIAYATGLDRSYPSDILKPNDNPGFLHIPGLFCYIDEIDNLTECNTKRMYEIAVEIRDLKKIFSEE
jgi:hypothetical protein